MVDDKESISNFFLIWNHNYLASFLFFATNINFFHRIFEISRKYTYSDILKSVIKKIEINSRLECKTAPIVLLLDKKNNSSIIIQQTCYFLLKSLIKNIFFKLTKSNKRVCLLIFEVCIALFYLFYAK